MKLRELKNGTKFKICGWIGTLVYRNDCRAHIKREDGLFLDISPNSEVEIIELPTVRDRGAAAGAGPVG